MTDKLSKSNSSKVKVPAAPEPRKGQQFDDAVLFNQSPMVNQLEEYKTEDILEAINIPSYTKPIKIGILGGSFDPPTISHLQLCSEAFNSLKFDEIWMVPCGYRKDKNNKVDPHMRLMMCQSAIQDYFPKDYPVRVCDIEVQNGSSIPTYFMMKKLEEKHKEENMEFYFLAGTDLIPGLVKWEMGQQLLDEIRFVIFSRRGYEKVLSAENRDYQLPRRHEILNASDNLIGMISSTEVRRRISTSKTEAMGQIQKHMDLTNISEHFDCGQSQQKQQMKAVQNSHYFFQIGGLVTKSVIELINKYKLYTDQQIAFQKEEKKKEFFGQWEQNPILNSVDTQQLTIKSSNPNILVKQTHLQEIKFYEQVFTENDPIFTKFRQFIPKYFGQIEDEHKMMIQNLLFEDGVEKDQKKTSIIDITIGTSTVTDSVSKNAEKLKKTIKNDQETTSAKLGYRIIGYSIKKDGEPDEEMVKTPHKSVINQKNPNKSVKETEATIQKFFAGKTKQLMKCYLFVGDLFDLMKSVPLEFRGASIFIVINGDTCDIKLIDLASNNKIYDSSKRDEGFLLGLQSLRQLFFNIFTANEKTFYTDLQTQNQIQRENQTKQITQQLDIKMKCISEIVNKAGNESKSEVQKMDSKVQVIENQLTDVKNEIQLMKQDMQDIKSMLQSLISK